MSDADADPSSPPGAGALAARMGISIVQATPDIVVGTMPVAGNTQPHGLLHGGASAVLAETLGSIGAALHAQGLAPGSTAAGVDLSITHLRAVRAGTVTGTATPLRRGRTIAAYTIDISDEDGEIVASARLTCAIRLASAT